jgi:hypothetical protein
MDQMEHFSSSLELQLQVQAKNTDAHPTPQHEKSAYRDHSYDRHDFFLLVFFMISTLSMSQYRGMPLICPKRPLAGRLPPKAPRSPLTKTIGFFSKNNRSTRDLDVALERHGATRFYPRVDCDVDYELAATHWIYA